MTQTDTEQSNMERLLDAYQRCVDRACDPGNGPVAAREWFEAATAAANAFAATVGAGNPKRHEEREDSSS